MSKVLRAALFSLMTVISGMAQAADLNEQGVNQLIQAMDAAIAKKDAAGVAALMSPDVNIRMTISTQGPKQVLTPNRDQYLAMLKDGWAVSTNYTYRRTGMRTQFTGKNKAVVKASIQESMNIQGQQIKGASEEEVTIELVKGVPLITKVVGVATM